MDVPVISAREWDSAQPSSQDRDTRIQKRVREGKDRNEPSRDVRRVCCAFHRENGEKKSHDEAARISQKEFCLGKVVAQETEKRTYQSSRVEGHGGVTQHQRRSSTRDKADDRHSARQSIEAVDKVEGVRDTHQPENRDGQCCYSEMKRVSRNQGDVFDAEAAVVDDERRDRLGGELCSGRDSANVVEKPNDEENRACNYEGFRELWKLGDCAGEGSFSGGGGDNADRQRGKDCHTSDARNARRAPLAAAFRKPRLDHDAREPPGDG